MPVVAQELAGGETWGFPLVRVVQNLCLDLAILQKCDECDQILVSGRNLLYSVN